jgi:SAM-dependent methyltransferase
MEHRDAVTLIATAVGRSSGVWADLGAGTGTFTRALAALLSPGSSIYAVDKDERAVAALRSLHVRDVGIVPVRADFATFDLESALDATALDGVLLANALHFVPNADEVLRRIVRHVRPGGRVVVVEYDRRAWSRWVPFPIAADDLRELTAHAGLVNFSVTAMRPSAYAGTLYAAAADRGFRSIDGES